MRMKTYFCWRCEMDVPMLEEHEWNRISPYLDDTLLSIKQYRITHNCDLATAKSRVMDLACDKYNEITGFNETNGLAIWHHRLSNWGP